MLSHQSSNGFRQPPNAKTSRLLVEFASAGLHKRSCRGSPRAYAAPKAVHIMSITCAASWSSVDRMCMDLNERVMSREESEEGGRQQQLSTHRHLHFAPRHPGDWHRHRPEFRGPDELFQGHFHALRLKHTAGDYHSIWKMSGILELDLRPGCKYIPTSVPKSPNEDPVLCSRGVYRLRGLGIGPKRRLSVCMRLAPASRCSLIVALHCFARAVYSY